MPPSNLSFICWRPSLTDRLTLHQELRHSVTRWCHRVCRRGPAIHVAPAGLWCRSRGRWVGWGSGRALAGAQGTRSLIGGGPDWGGSRPCWSTPADRGHFNNTCEVIHIHLQQLLRFSELDYGLFGLTNRQFSKNTAWFFSLVAAQTCVLTFHVFLKSKFTSLFFCFQDDKVSTFFARVHFYYECLC